MTMETQGRPDWGLGSYEPTADQLRPAAELIVERAAPAAGEVVLDVGCGTGNAALLAAATGAEVTGVDPAPRLLGLARDRAAAEGREIAFLEGAAESLPVPDASVDVVLSVFGVIFAPDAHRAAAELARVTADDGRILLTAWIPDGAITRVAGMWRTAVFAALEQEPPPGFGWHDREALRGLFGPHGFSIEVEEATLVHGGASLDEYTSDVLDVHPLSVGANALLEQTGEAARLRAQARAILAEANEDPERFAITARYAIVTARRA